MMMIGCQLPRGKFVLYDRFDFCGHSIPPGFVTDFDSVPRIPIVYWLLKNRTTFAAAHHDFFYASGADRKAADNEFLRMMKIEGVRRRYRLPIWLAVRLFGWVRYRKKSRQFNPWARVLVV